VTEPQPSPERLAELRDGVGQVRASIAEACSDAGRDPDSVTLIAVTKTFPATDVRGLAALGVTDIGENRDRELKVKGAECADLDVGWHFVGQLQSNKARSVVQYAGVVHSVDRPTLVHALTKAAASTGRTVRCLLQVSLSDDAGKPQRGGVLPAAVDELAELVAGADGLELGGVMAVAPLGADPDRAFAELAVTADRVRRHHRGATWISAGMSGDLAAAIRHGATHVRVGRALLGPRTTLG
jgi:pyridoxal phosphate enzyme (YggS family)